MNGNPPDRFSVTPEPATVGQPVTICYSNPDRPNQWINMKLTNALASGQQGYEELTFSGYTDSNGLVCWAIYEFPDWLAHVAKADDSADHPIPTQ